MSVSSNLSKSSASTSWWQRVSAVLAILGLVIANIILFSTLGLLIHDTVVTIPPEPLVKHRAEIEYHTTLPKITGLVEATALPIEEITLLSNSMPDTMMDITPSPTPVIRQQYLITPTAVFTDLTSQVTIKSSPTPSAVHKIPFQPTPTVMTIDEQLAVISITPTAKLIPQTSSNQVKHVVIISIDGLRPDALFLAYTPNIDSLREKGAYSDKAQTLSLSITLPSHASMLSGMTPDKHGIQWGLPYIGWPGMAGPTVFNVAHDAGLQTAMVYGKQKLNYLVLGDSVDQLFSADAHDPQIKEEAVNIIQTDMPNLLFVHFPDTDRVGHAYGWMSENQIYAITFVDGLVGELVAALETGGYMPNTMIILTADHGGHGFGHGDDSPLDRTIPWLAVGPNISAGLTINQHINTYDTAATVAHALKLPIPKKWDGRPVMEIFE